MKILPVIIYLALSSLSFQASASLTWVDTPDQGDDTVVDGALFGDYSATLDVGDFTHDWKFNLDVPTEINIKVREYTNRSAHIEGVTLLGVAPLIFSLSDHLWSYNSLTPLASGDYTLEIKGHVHAAQPGGIQIGAVPVPAAFWLFGSALLGLLGITKRINTAGVAQA